MPSTGVTAIIAKSSADRLVPTELERLNPSQVDRLIVMGFTFTTTATLVRVSVCPHSETGGHIWLSWSRRSRGFGACRRPFAARFAETAVQLHAGG